MSLETRRSFLEKDKFSLRKQCEALALCRSSIYYEEQQASSEDIILMHLIDEQYLKTPFYGSRKMVVHLKVCGYEVNRKKVQRLMRAMGIQGICPGPNTSKRRMEHRVYPYLLGGIVIQRPNQVWAADITYIRLSHGFCFLFAILDLFSRCVLGWRLSNTLDSWFCMEALKEVLEKVKPEIFNTDQGCQFTSEEFTGLLLEQEVQISMDSKGRAIDNIFVERFWRSVKYENIYLKGYGTIVEAREGLAEYMRFYNQERYHQSLDYKTPLEMYELKDFKKEKRSKKERIKGGVRDWDGLNLPSLTLIKKQTINQQTLV